MSFSFAPSAGLVIVVSIALIVRGDDDGSPVTGCSTIIDCSTCNSYTPSSPNTGDTCVWCESLGICLPGPAEMAGPFCPNDNIYTSSQCTAKDECGGHSNCFDCLSRPVGACGWCVSSSLCISADALKTCEYGFDTSRDKCGPDLEQVASSCAACLLPLGEYSSSSSRPVVWCPAESFCRTLPNISSPDPDGCANSFSGPSKRHYSECSTVPPPGEGDCASLSYTSCDQCTQNGCNWCFSTNKCHTYSYQCTNDVSTSNRDHCHCDAIQSLSNCVTTNNPFCTWCASEGKCKYSPFLLGPTILKSYAVDYQCKGNSYSEYDNDCSQFDDCRSCAGTKFCGWCQFNTNFGACISGTIAGPKASPDSSNYGSTCQGGVWSTSKHQCDKSVPIAGCSQYKSGNSCTSSEFGSAGCGWCGLSKECFAGNSDGPFPPNTCPFQYWTYE